MNSWLKIDFWMNVDSLIKMAPHIKVDCQGEFANKIYTFQHLDVWTFYIIKPVYCNDGVSFIRRGEYRDFSQFVWFKSLIRIQENEVYIRIYEIGLIKNIILFVQYKIFRENWTITKICQLIREIINKSPFRKQKSFNRR